MIRDRRTGLFSESNRFLSFSNRGKIWKTLAAATDYIDKTSSYIIEHYRKTVDNNFTTDDIDIAVYTLNLPPTVELLPANQYIAEVKLKRNIQNKYSSAAVQMYEYFKDKNNPTGGILYLKDTSAALGKNTMIQLLKSITGLQPNQYKVYSHRNTSCIWLDSQDNMILFKLAYTGSVEEIKLVDFLQKSSL